jgi:hypothetical protein
VSRSEKLVWLGWGKQGGRTGQGREGEGKNPSSDQNVKNNVNMAGFGFTPTAIQYFTSRLRALVL